MKEILTVVTRKGQITVPSEIRQALGLKQGDKVALSLSSDPQKLQVSLRPVKSVADMTYGAIQARKKPENFKELRTLFMEGVGEDVIKETEHPRKKNI